MITFYASQVHYFRHLAPVASCLTARGVGVQVRARDVHSPWGTPIRPGERLDGLVVVASADDARDWRRNPLVYVEHGAGQTYVDAVAEGLGFSGGPRLENVVLFVCPNEQVADRWRARYPQAKVAVVGCPVLDAHRPPGRMGGRYRGQDVRRDATDSVYVTSHWRSGACPETMPALPHFLDAVAGLVPHFEVVGHAHPRIAARLSADWGRLGIPFEPDPDVVLDRAGLLIADNTSLLFEAAAIGVPVVALNAPWYRRDVEHGLRFWSHVPGLQCDRPEDLEWTVRLALAGGGAELGTRAARYVYGALDGPATERAADAILSVEGAPMPHDPSPEVRGHLDEILDRLDQLGATDEEIDELRAQWPEMDAEDRDGLRRMNDTRLAQELADTRAENDFHAHTPEEAKAAAEERAQALRDRANEAQMWAILNDSVPNVLTHVEALYAADHLIARDEALRLHRLESSARTRRKTLLDGLTDIIRRADEVQAG